MRKRTISPPLALRHRPPLCLLLVLGLGLSDASMFSRPAQAAERGAAKITAVAGSGHGAEKKRHRRPRRRKKRGRRGLRARDFYVYDHLIRRGDTVGKIARRYEVTQEQILSWNDLTSPHLIREGRTLTIYSKKRRPQYERADYRVKRGDTLGKIARRHHMTVRQLRSVNGLRGDLIRPGQRLVVLKPKDPEIVRLGRHGRRRVGRGYLTGALQLRSSKGFYVKNPRESWGTPSTVRQIKRAFREMSKNYRRSEVCVGDISLREGGPLSGHRSHQRGIDVDIGYYRKRVARDRRFYRVTPRTLDARRTWRLIHQFLVQGLVDMIFVDYALQQPLYDEAQRTGVPRGKLDHWFQYPRGRHARRGTIRHESGHANHMHVRFLDMRRSAGRGHRSGAAL